MVRVLRIIEHEEELDERKTREQQFQELSSPRSPSNASKLKIRGYKKQLLDHITNSIIDFFEGDGEDQVGAAHSVDAKLDLITRAYEDNLLDKVPNYVEDCFPPSYGIVNFYAKTYENQLIKVC
jgi:hypothetical protein